MSPFSSPASHSRPASSAVRWLAWSLAAAVTLTALVFGSRDAGGADSYGYVSQADLWLSGRLSIPSPWMQRVPWPAPQLSFAPLGWHSDEARTALVPGYAPGLPLLMAGAKAVAGHCAVFWVVPLCGGLLVVATWRLGERLAPPGAGLGAAWLLATSPTLLFQALQPMSDVPAAAAWTAVFLALTWRTTRAAVAAGLAASLAVLIRPNLVGCLVPLGLWWLWRIGLAFRAARPGHRPPVRDEILRGVIFGLCASLGPVLVAWLNWRWFGSPFRSGYGTPAELYALGNVPGNVRAYLTWFRDTQALIPVLGLAVLFLPLRRLWGAAVPRPLVLAIAGCAAFTVFQYLTYQVFDNWTFLRFFLPILPVAMIGAAVGGAAVARQHRVAAWVVVVAAVALGWRGIDFARSESVFRIGRAEGKYHEAGALVRQMTPARSVVLSNQHSGSVRYYGGRMTLQYESLDPEWLDRTVSWLAAREVPTYALLESWEVERFRARFGAASELGRLERPPLLVYYGSAQIFLFDLTRPADELQTMKVPARGRSPVCVRPEPPPTLDLPPLPTDGTGR